MRTTAIATTSTASALRLAEDGMPTKRPQRLMKVRRMWRIDPQPGTG